MARLEKQPITDGHWWTANKAVPVRCQKCPYWHKQRVTVIRYKPEWDYVGQWERDYPGVTNTGWVLWAWCRKRGGRYDQWFAAVEERDVRRWDAASNGWHRNDQGNQGGYLP